MKERTYAILAAAAVAALIGGTALYIFLPASPTGDKVADALTKCRMGQVGGGSIGGPFTLVNGATGATVTDKEVISKPTLVYFGYTFCPDVCPLDMSNNAEVVDILEERGMDLGLAFITVDPERDTAQVVADFAQNIHPKAIGLTGTPEQIKVAAAAYRTTYSKQESEDEFYLVNHMAFTYLMDPKRGFLDFYRHDAPPEQVAESAACYIQALAGEN
jgi:protein SCO1/2